MGNTRACKWCRTGRYISDPRKHFRDCHLCFECMMICELMVKHLVPASERKSPYADSFGRAGYYKAIPYKSRLGILAKSEDSLSHQRGYRSTGIAIHD